MKKYFLLAFLLVFALVGWNTFQEQDMSVEKLIIVDVDEIGQPVFFTNYNVTENLILTMGVEKPMYVVGNYLPSNSDGFLIRVGFGSINRYSTLENAKKKQAENKFKGFDFGSVNKLV